MFWEKEGKLIYSYDGETVCIEAWGKDALRVRATKNRSFTGRDWALEAKDAHAGEVEIFEDPSAKGGAFANMYEGTDTSYGKITNGKEDFGASLCQKDKTAPHAPSETVQGALSLRFRECCGDQSADR